MNIEKIITKLIQDKCEFCEHYLGKWYSGTDYIKACKLKHKQSKECEFKLHKDYK